MATMSMQQRKCGITSCKNFHSPSTKGPHVYFFEVPPPNTNLGKKWLDALGNLAVEFSGTFYVCSLHFPRNQILVYETTTKGLKYAKLARGALPTIPPPEKYPFTTNPVINSDVQVKDTIRFVDIEAIRNCPVISNNDDDEVLQPQPQPLEKPQPKLQVQPSSCAQCRIYSVKLQLAEKRCRELEEFIQTTLKSVSKNDNKQQKEESCTLTVSILSVEKCTPAEFLKGKSNKIETSQGRKPEQNTIEILSDNDDDLNKNDDVEILSIEAPSDNSNDEDETVAQIQSKDLKITEPTTISQKKSTSSLGKQTALMYNYYKCDMCNMPKRFKSTSELKSHQTEHHLPVASAIYIDQTNKKRGRVESTQSSEKKPTEKPAKTVMKISENYTQFLSPVYKAIYIDQPIAKRRRVESTQSSKKKPTEKPAKTIIKISEDSTPFKCGICMELVVFKTAMELQHHIREQHSKTKNQPLPRDLQYECYICKRELLDGSDAISHLKEHVRARDEKCYVCKEMLTAKELNHHICTMEKRIRCDYCTKSFRAVIKLIQHVDSEHETEKIHHKCNKCSRFWTMVQLRDIHEMHHKDEAKKYLCEICSKGFSNEYRWKYHVDTHSNTKNYLCSECGKGFGTHRILVCHMKTHEEKTIQCPECPAKFNTNRSFQIHCETHFPIKLQCNLCPKILTTRKSYERHTRLHRITESDKKHACSFCPFKCWKKHKLQVHMRSHTGEKPYKCEYCDQTYKYNGDLTKHLQIHLGVNIYKCKSCEMGFRLYEDLRRHSFEHYKKEREKQDSNGTNSRAE